jgi:hypothetical protein
MSQSRISPALQSRFNRFLVLEHLLGHDRFERKFSEKKRGLVKEIQAELERTPPGQLREVPRVKELSPEEFRRDYFDKTLPVVFEGAAKSWPCCQKWNLDHLAVHHGDEEILIAEAEGLTDAKSDKKYELLSLRELIENIRAGGDKYLRFSPLLEKIPALAKDIDLAWLGSYKPKGTLGNTYYMFVGPKGTRTKLHSDQPCNLFVQVHGQKKWTIFPIEFTAAIDPGVSKTAYFDSPVDLNQIDLATDPMFKHVDGWQVTLNPGDVMYIPPHLWHHVENVTDTISIGYRFSSLAAAWKASPTLTFLRAIAMNPPIWKTIKYGKVDTNLIWAHASGVLEQVLAEKEKRASAAKR